MKLPSHDRARWLAQHIVPHERAIRSWLARRTHDLDIDDIVQEMYARLASVENAESIRNPRQYAAQTAISIALNLARHARVVPMIPIGDFEELGLASLEPSPERAVNSQDELKELENTLKNYRRSAAPHSCCAVSMDSRRRKWQTNSASASKRSKNTWLGAYAS
jgi:DNA-directed RNA polymerase specialized sigma24 family protein